MKYVITDLAKQNPNLFQLPSGEFVGVGGPYEVNGSARCGSCTAKEQAEFDKQQAGKPKRTFREALPHEYEILAKQYEGSGGIPGYLIIVPDEPKPAQQKGSTIDKE